MARQMEGRVRYDGEKDAFVYELWDEEAQEWGMVRAAKCFRREGQDDDDEAEFIHFGFMKQLVHDVQEHGVRLHMA